MESFQTAEGLAADGIVGPATWTALLRFAPAPVTWTHGGARIASAAAGAAPRPAARSYSPVPRSGARGRATRDEIAGAGGAH